MVRGKPCGTGGDKGTNLKNENKPLDLHCVSHWLPWLGIRPYLLLEYFRVEGLIGVSSREKDVRNWKFL